MQKNKIYLNISQYIIAQRDIEVVNSITNTLTF